MERMDTYGFSEDYDSCIKSGDDEAREWMDSHPDVYSDEVEDGTDETDYYNYDEPTDEESDDNNNNDD